MPDPSSKPNRYLDSCGCTYDDYTQAPDRIVMVLDCSVYRGNFSSLYRYTHKCRCVTSWLTGITAGKTVVLDWYWPDERWELACDV